MKDWSSSDKTLSAGKARRVSACSANQFQQFVTPDDGRKFTELYNVQHLQWSSRGRCDIDLRPEGFTSRRASDQWGQWEAVRHRREALRVKSRERFHQSAQLDRVSRVCICTIQRLYAMLRSFFFLLNKRRPQGQITRGDRPRSVRVLRTVWTRTLSYAITTL